MEVYERLHYLRKHVLKMSMDAFGSKLGVSRSVIVNIEGNKLARPEQKLSLMKLIAKTFGVREEWILQGDEPMFDPKFNTFDLNELLIRENVRPEDMEMARSIVHMYLDLSPETRTEIFNKFSKFTKSNNTN